MAVAWWLRQLKTAVGPVGPDAGRVMLERDAGVRLSRLTDSAAYALR